MKATLAALWFLTLAAAFGLARLTGPDSVGPGLQAVDSFREALEERDPLIRSFRLSASLQKLGPEDLPAVLEALEAHQIGVTPEEVRLLMLAWTRFDAPGAFAWASDWPTRWRQTLMSEAMYAWGFRDGRSALRALESTEDPELQARLRQSLLEGWLSADDVEGAGEYIAAVSDPRRRGRLTFLLAGETMKKGVEAAMRWAEGVPEDAPNNFKQGAFYHASGMVARADPQRAAEWFEKHRARPYTVGSLEGIARKWVQHHDPAALFDWLRSLPAEAERESERSAAIAAGFRVWRRRAPEEAEAWLALALPSPELDPAVVELVRARSQSSPESAVEWVGHIQDEKLRRRSALLAGRLWWRQDPEAVRAWLAESELPEDVRQSILNGPPGSPRRRAAPAEAGAR